MTWKLAVGANNCGFRRGTIASVLFYNDLFIQPVSFASQHASDVFKSASKCSNSSYFAPYLIYLVPLINEIMQDLSLPDRQLVHVLLPEFLCFPSNAQLWHIWPLFSLQLFVPSFFHTIKYRRVTTLTTCVSFTFNLIHSSTKMISHDNARCNRIRWKHIWELNELSCVCSRDMNAMDDMGQTIN